MGGKAAEKAAAGLDALGEAAVRAACEGLAAGLTDAPLCRWLAAQLEATPAGDAPADAPLAALLGELRAAWKLRRPPADEGEEREEAPPPMARRPVLLLLEEGLLRLPWEVTPPPPPPPHTLCTTTPHTQPSPQTPLHHASQTILAHHPRHYPRTHTLSHEPCVPYTHR